MHRREFLKTSATAAACLTVPFGLKIPTPEPKKSSGWKHFEFMRGEGSDAKYRCKLCRGTFWVDACTEENLRLYRFPHKSYPELVPECEWCKLHEGHGVPAVPHWGSQISRFRGLYEDGGDDKYIFDWLDSAIEGYIDSRWSSYTEGNTFATCLNTRDVFLPAHLATLCAHKEGHYVERFGCHFKWGYGKILLVREIQYPVPPSKFEPFIVYRFQPTTETRYADNRPHCYGV